jgi:iron complex transport system permease protein
MTLATVWLAAGLGAHGWQLPRFDDPLVTELRLPRIVTALLVGASLAASGAALQALFRNPLADPTLIGTSSGAALGVVAVIAGGVTGLAVPFAAFAGGLAATVVVLALNRLVNGGQAGLLIIGVVVGAFCGAVISLLMLLSDDMTLRGAMAWLAGNLSDAGFSSLGQVSLIMALGLALLLALGRDLDCLMLGEDTAASLGIKVEHTRTLTAIAAALLTGAAVSVSGIIGFIGMMVPNAIALRSGGCRRKLIWRSAWAGALFLLAIDTLGRHIAYPIDLPAGVIAAFAGPPFLLWLLFRQQGGRND